MSIGAGMAYEDWAQGATRTPFVDPNGNIGTFASLFSPQLSDCFGVTRLVPTGSALAGGSVSWGDARPVGIVSLLDVRASGSVGLDVFGLGPDAGPITDSFIYPGYPSSDFVRHLHFMFDVSRSLTGVGLSMNALTVGSSITIGRLWAGPLWRVPEGIKRAWRSAVFDPGERALSPGGQNYPSDEQRRRWVKMGFSHVSFEQAYGREDNSVLDLQQLQMRVGTTSHVIVFPRLQEHAIHRVGVYGTVTEWDPIENVAGDYFTSGLRVEENL